jgi:hypothetical protein
MWAFFKGCVPFRTLCSVAVRIWESAIYLEYLTFFSDVQAVGRLILIVEQRMAII